MEIWVKLKIVDGFRIKPNTYEINRYGHIRNIKTKRAYKYSPRNDGYCVILLRLSNNSRRLFYVHRIMYNVFIKTLYDTSSVVDHIDFNRSNNIPENLQLISQHANIRRSIDAGRINSTGSHNIKAVLTDYQVHEICKLLKNGNIKYDDILLSVGLDISKRNRDILSKIHSGKNWSHISRQYGLKPRKRKSINSHKHLTNEVESLLCENKTIAEIADMLNIPKERNERQKFWKFADRINRQFLIIDTNNMIY